MDGGRRLLRSLGILGGRLVPAPLTASPLAFAGCHDPQIFPVMPQVVPRLPSRRRHRGRLLLHGIARVEASRFFGTALSLVLIASATFYGAVRGGAYSAFVEANGSISDIAARFIGFPVKTVTIVGAHEQRENEILKIAGIKSQSSLLFLDVDAVRKRLKAVPLIKDASVSKLYPNRLLIEMEERQPSGLWQKDGNVSIVAADGTPIDDLHDSRFEHLPLVVGEGANTKLSDYLAILDAAGELRNRIRAGIYVSGRRWTLKMDNGVEVDLAESDPVSAISRFAMLEHDSHILEKSIISVDLRIPGRVAARLTEDASAARAAAIASKSKKKAAST